MNMFRALMELDKINEMTSISETYNDFGDRQELIAKIKALGRNYCFDKYSNKQLFKIWQKESSKEAQKRAEEAAYRDFYASKTEKPICAECGRLLSDVGYCPVCDDGEEELDEDIFNSLPSTISWVTFTGVPVNSASNTQPSTNQNSSEKPIVTIVYDNVARKLRARADDGIHGEANVAFPNALRIRSGLQYEVDELIWNGKNYRVSGNINQL